jgi:hypothetical protein
MRTGILSSSGPQSGNVVINQGPRGKPTRTVRAGPRGMNWRILLKIARQARLNEFNSGRPRGINPSGGIK